MRAVTQMRLERAVRLELLGCKRKKIAQIVGLTIKGLEALRARPEYRMRRSQLVEELLTRMDYALFEAKIAPISNDGQNEPGVSRAFALSVMENLLSTNALRPAKAGNFRVDY